MRDGPGLGAPRDPGGLVAPREPGCPVPLGTLFCPLLLVTVQGILALRSWEAPGRECSGRGKTGVLLRPVGHVLGPVPRPGHLAASRGQGGAGKPAGRSAAGSSANSRLVHGGETEAWGGGRWDRFSLASMRPSGAAPVPPPSLRTAPGPGPGWRASLGGAGPPWWPAGRGDGGRPALIVSMGDDFQGEISSSVESLSFRRRTKCHPRPAPGRGRSPVAFKFTPLSLPDTCLNQYLPLQVVGRMCPALHTALLKSTKINTIIEIFSS